jgi:transcriptional regulator with XRE-family HTH domain
MPQSLNNYIRRQRKRLGLSQRELSFLIGKKDHSYISRLEKGRRVPNLETAMQLSVILRTPIPELFAGRFEKVEAAVMARALEPSLAKKSKALDRAIAALTEHAQEE